MMAIEEVLACTEQVSAGKKRKMMMRPRFFIALS